VVNVANENIIKSDALGCVEGVCNIADGATDRDYLAFLDLLHFLYDIVGYDICTVELNQECYNVYQEASKTFGYKLGSKESEGKLTFAIKDIPNNFAYNGGNDTTEIYFIGQAYGHEHTAKLVGIKAV
jgi:hypothetical protein